MDTDGNGPKLPLRGQRNVKQESPDQLVGKLHTHLKRQQWRGLRRLLLLLKFMARCNPALASQLAQAGGVSALLGVVQGVLGASPRPSNSELLLAATLSLLKKVAYSNLNAAADAVAHAPAAFETSSHGASRANVLVRVMCDPNSGTQARRKAAHLLRSLVEAGHQRELLTHGLLKELPAALEHPTTACDFSFLQDVLWCMMALVGDEVEAHGGVQHPLPLLHALLPLLYVTCESRSLHLRHLLAAVLRILYLLAVNDAVVKEQLQQLGFVDCLVRVICTDCWAADPCAPSPQDPHPTASFARTRSSSSTRSAREASADGAAGQAGPSWDSSQSPASKDARGYDLQPPPDSPEGWWRLWAAALMGPVLEGVRSSSSSSSSTSGGDSMAGGGAVEAAAGAGSGGAQQEVDKWAGISTSAICIYGLLLPLQRARTPRAAARQEQKQQQQQQWLCPIKEAFNGLLVMLCADDVNAQWLNDHIIVRAGPALVHLVAKGDMQLAWQAANTLGHLATSPHSSALMSLGMVEELTYFLQESADALHALTVRRQLEEHAFSGHSSTRLPIPHSAYAYHGREPANHTKNRVRLVGRQRVTVNESWCMYGSHAPTAMCDYCVPSACLRALLRLMSLPAEAPSQSSSSPPAGLVNGASSKGWGPSIDSTTHHQQPCSSSLSSSSSNGFDASSTPARVGMHAGSSSGSGGNTSSGGAANQDVARRFTGAGGLYALFLLLHHELCGVHPSKMASSLLTLLNMVLDACPTFKDEVRKVGGLGLLTALMGSLAKSDRVTDIFQLRVRICCSLQYVLEGNQANKLLAREHGLLDPLVLTLRHATSPNATQVSVLDDAEQVTVSTLELLATTVDDSRGNQAALVAAGGLPLLHDLLMKPSISPDVLVAVVRVFELMVQGCEPAKLAILGTPALSHLVGLANNTPASPLAQRVVALSCRLIAAHPQGKTKVLASGVLPLLLKMLHTSPCGAHTGAASQGLYAVTLGDVDLQNEVAAQGGFQAIENIIHNSQSMCSHALWLLCCLMYGNSFMKNEARQAGFVQLLVDLTQAHGITQPDITVPALHALAQMCQSNSQNQRAVVEAGGMTMVCAFLQRMLEARGGAETGGRGSGGVPAAALQGGMASATMHAAVLDAVVRLLGALVEFNAQNQALARDSGCLARTADLLMLAAEVHDLDVLRATQLFPAVSAACAAVARAAQDCEANQQWLMQRHEDLAAALFRLLSVDEPYVALDASRALEFVAIRSDQAASAGEDRAEFEADAVHTIVRILHSRGNRPVHPPSAAVAAAAAVLGGAARSGSKPAAAAGAGGAHAKDTVALATRSQVTSYTVQEAAHVLHSILRVVPGTAAAAAQPPARKRVGLLRGFTRASKQPAPPPPLQVTVPRSGRTEPAAAAPGGASSPQASSPTVSVLPPPQQQQHSLVSLSSLKPNPKAGPHGWGVGRAAAAPDKRQQQQQQGQGEGAPAGVQMQALGGAAVQQQGQGELGPAQNGAGSASACHQEHGPEGTGPSTEGDTSLLQPPPSPQTQTNNESNRLLCIENWTTCSGCSPAAFQAIAANVGGGPWHFVKVQLAWVLFLLAAKSPANRSLIQHLLRTMVTPLAQQLANAEAFYASDEAFAALTMQDPVDCPPTPLPISTLASDKQQQQQQQQRRRPQHLQDSAASLQQQQQPQQLQTHQGGGAYGNALPSAPNPNPLQQGPAFGSPREPDQGTSIHSGSSDRAAAAAAAAAGSAMAVTGSKGELGAQTDARSSAPEGDDELSMIEAEVAMLAHFGGGLQALPAAVASRGGLSSPDV